jgi:hypothetical protein
VGERDADYGRQELGRQAYRQRERKEKRVYQRLGQKEVDR